MKSWERRLAYDITGRDDIFIPPDFDEELREIEERYLGRDEAEVIRLCYEEGQTVEEAAKRIGIDPSNTAIRKNTAVLTLRDHMDELFAGKRYMDEYHDLRKEYDEYAEIVRWMDEALKYLSQVDEESSEPVEELSPVVRDFCRWKGFRTLRDIYGMKPRELIEELGDYAVRHASHNSDITSDTELDTMDFSPDTLKAFKDAGLITVEDALSLTDEEAAALPKSGRAGIIHLYRMV